MRLELVKSARARIRLPAPRSNVHRPVRRGDRGRHGNAELVSRVAAVTQALERETAALDVAANLLGLQAFMPAPLVAAPARLTGSNRCGARI